jgi:hypothetical protein
VNFTGVVKSIYRPHWVITRDDDHKDIALNWPEIVPISLGTKVGDHVAVVAIEHTDGTFTAIMIVPRR